MSRLPRFAIVPIPSMRSSIFESFCTTAYFQVGLAEKLTELEAEKEEKIRNSFVVRNHFFELDERIDTSSYSGCMRI